MLLLCRFDDEEEILASAPVEFTREAAVEFELVVKGDELSLSIIGNQKLIARDGRFTSGGAGFLIEKGCVPARGFSVQRIEV